MQLELLQHVCLDCHGSYHPTRDFVAQAWRVRDRLRKKKKKRVKRPRVKTEKIPKKERTVPFGKTPFRYRMKENLPGG